MMRTLTSDLCKTDWEAPALNPMWSLWEASITSHSGFSRPGLLEKRGEFPQNKDDQFSLSDDAKQFYKSGGPFWQRFLPFWLAAWIDRFVFVVIPLMAILLPLRNYGGIASEFNGGGTQLRKGYFHANLILSFITLN